MASPYTLCGLLLSLATPCLAYKIATLDALDNCNQTIYLDDGPKSAAILTLTTKSSYDFTPMYCIIHFIAPMHKWSGLTGVLEEIDLRRIDDPTRHRDPENMCVDYILVEALTDKTVKPPQGRQCGTWSVGGQDKLSDFGHRRALVGYCPSPPATSAVGMQRCGVSEIHVEVSVGQDREDLPPHRNVKWRQYRGFTLVVTAYMYSYRESECAVGLRSCGAADREGLQHKCIHQSLWCDHHINCGQPHNLDEISCFNSYVTMEGLVPVMVGPWVGAALLLLLLLAGVVYWRRARPPAPRDPRPPQELNSYAESYEVSSTLSSAHHMAIQVRVVCNSGHGAGGSGATHLTGAQPPPPRTLHRWPGHTPPKMDLPPSYDSLFPHGPPSPRGCTSAEPPTPASAASLDITATTTSMLSLGSCQGGTSPGHYPPPAAAAAATTTQTSNIVIPLSAMCTSHTPTVTKATATATATATTSYNSAGPSTDTLTGSHSKAGPSTSTSAASPQPSTSTAHEGHAVEFTPLVQPEDSAISLSSLCGEHSLPDNVPHAHSSHPSLLPNIPPTAAAAAAAASEEPPEYSTSSLSPG